MTQVGENPYIEPYLNPEYWDGHMIGQGNPERLVLPLRNREVKLASKAIEGYFAERAKPFPLEKYGKGDTFNCEEHDPGTIIFYNHETLHGLPEDVQALKPSADASLPVRPTDLDFQLRLAGRPSQGGSRIIQAGGVHYTNRKFFGVVLEDKSKEKILVRINSFNARRVPEVLAGGRQSTVSVHPAGNQEVSKITVGDTLHTRAVNLEFLSRAGALMLCARGTPETSRKLTERLSAFMLKPFGAQ